MGQTESEQSDRSHCANIWARLGSQLIDGLLIVVVWGGFVALDVYLLNGELGSFIYSETIERQEIENRKEAMPSAGIITFTKFIETRQDYNGRLKKIQVSVKHHDDHGVSSTVKSEITLEAEPDWGGKYKTIFAVFAFIGLVAYFSLMWSSKRQGTIGGRLIGLRVVGYNGEQVSLSHALLRTVAVIPASLTVIGYFMIAFTESKQALHDKLAKTLVHRVRNETN